MSDNPDYPQTVPLARDIPILFSGPMGDRRRISKDSAYFGIPLTALAHGTLTRGYQ